jgi:hypothetical protein
MESKLKKCKNKNCGKEFKQFNSLQNVCGAKCSKELKEQKKANQKPKEPVTDRKILILKAQTVFNAYIRERDKGQPCICCGRPLGKNYHCGHFYSSGGHSNVRFNEDNANGQRADCNTTHRAGMLSDYGQRLEEKIGVAAFEVLRAEAYEPKKWEVKELEAIIKEYSFKLKELQSGRKEAEND